MIDLALLGLLKEHDLHGYEIRKRLGELLGSRLAISFGSIYPALARLERSGCVKAVTHLDVPLPAAPMSGSLAGELAAFRATRASESRAKRGSRGKKVYGITEKGHERLYQLLTSPEASDRDFPVRVAFCHHLTSEDRLALFEQRRAELLERKARRWAAGGPDGAHAPMTGRFNRYLRSLLEHDTEVVSADLAWLDRLIAAERAALAEPAHKPGESAEQ